MKIGIGAGQDIHQIHTGLWLVEYVLQICDLCGIGNGLGELNMDILGLHRYAGPQNLRIG